LSPETALVHWMAPRMRRSPLLSLNVEIPCGRIAGGPSCGTLQMEPLASLPY